MKAMNNDLRLEETFIFRYRMSSKDEFYGGGIVNGSRSITLMGDLADRIAAKVFGNVGQCVAVPKVRLYEPVFAGNYMECVGRVTRMENDEIDIECRAFKVVATPENPPFPSSVDVLEDPVLSTVVHFTYKSRG